MPREVIFESGSSGQAPEKALLLGSKDRLHNRQTDGKERPSGLPYGWVLKLGMTPGHWDRVEPEPPVELLEEAVSYIREGSFDSYRLWRREFHGLCKMAAVMAENPISKSPIW